MMTLLLLPILLGMTGLAIDVGSYASERRTLQNAADSIALAAGRDLPNSAAVQAAALDYAAKNSIDTTGMTVLVTGGSTTPRVKITLVDMHEFSFIKALGVDDKTVGATATSGLFTQAGGTGVVPWSIEKTTVDASASGAVVTIKYDSGGATNGNFGAIRIDGSGASDYENSAKYGATAGICSTAMTGCTTSNCPSTSCPETAPECDGPECTPKTGNMTGPTRDAVDFRKDYTSTSCDTFAEAFSTVSASLSPEVADGLVAAYAGGGTGRSGVSFSRPMVPKTSTPTPTQTSVPTSTPTRTPTSTSVPPTSTNTPGATSTPTRTNTPGPAATGTNTPAPTATFTPVATQQEYALNGACNPWSGGSCATTTTLCSRRVFMIPIVNGFGNGSSDPVTVLGFALVFLEGYDSGKCTGSTCEIKARFVLAELTTNFSGSTYDPNSKLSFVKLVE